MSLAPIEPQNKYVSNNTRWNEFEQSEKCSKQNVASAYIISKIFKLFKAFIVAHMSEIPEIHCWRKTVPIYENGRHWRDWVKLIKIWDPKSEVNNLFFFKLKKCIFQGHMTRKVTCPHNYKIAVLSQKRLDNLFLNFWKYNKT